MFEEIEERRQFLAEMSELGRDREYRTKIETEISQVMFLMLTRR